MAMMLSFQGRLADAHKTDDSQGQRPSGFLELTIKISNSSRLILCPPVKQRLRRRPPIAQLERDVRQSLIRALYIKQSQTLPKILQEPAQQGFQPSPRQLVIQLRKWGMRKYRKKESADITADPASEHRNTTHRDNGTDMNGTPTAMNDIQAVSAGTVNVDDGLDLDSWTQVCFKVLDTRTPLPIESVELFDWTQFSGADTDNILGTTIQPQEWVETQMPALPTEGAELLASEPSPFVVASNDKALGDTQSGLELFRPRAEAVWI